jgi:hypothetical protein
MSANPPQCQGKLSRFILAGVLLGSLVLILLLAWKTSRSTRPAQPSATVPASSRPMPRQLSAQSILKYGRAEGEPGMIHESGQPPVGPESFAVGKDGNILVADGVNQRVLVYSKTGTYLRSISVPGIALGDVTADAQGRIYVYDQVDHALHQYGEAGAPQSTLKLNPKDLDTRGYFHVANSSVYFADAAARDVLVATVQDGRLTAPDSSLERTADGIHGESGRIYSLSVDKEQALRVEVRDPAAQPVSRTVAVPWPGIVSATYAGEDQAQRFYVQTERLAGAKIVLEVLAFSPAGEQLSATPMPENNYAIWTAKLVDVGADGTIVQFLPQQDQAKLNFFAK